MSRSQTDLAQDFTVIEHHLLTLIGELPYPPVTLAAQAYIRSEISRMFDSLREWSLGTEDSDIEAAGLAYIVGKALDR